MKTAAVMRGLKKIVLMSCLSRLFSSSSHLKRWQHETAGPRGHGEQTARKMCNLRRVTKSYEELRRVTKSYEELRRVTKSYESRALASQGSTHCDQPGSSENCRGVTTASTSRLKQKYQYAALRFAILCAGCPGRLEQPTQPSSKLHK